jgi:DNA-binding response OmpR family regulator
MKDVLLITPATGDYTTVVSKAAALTDRGFAAVVDSRRAFERLNSGLPEVDVLVVDIERGIHPMAIIESIAGCQNLPPVIITTDLEEEYMRQVVRRRGVAACLAKPFTAERLAAVIEKVARNDLPNEISCDAWGHPTCRRRRNKQAQPVC